MLCLSVVPTAASGLPPVDVEVKAAGTATVADLAEALGQHLVGVHSTSLLAPTTSGEAWPAARLLRDCDLRSGQIVEVETVPPSWRHSVPRPAPETIAVLEVIAGPDAGKAFPLTATSVVIGRAPESTVVLHDQEVSRRHARLLLGDQPILTDEGSSRGTVVGGTSVSRPTALSYGDPFTVGDTTLVLHDREQTGRAQATTDGSTLGADAITRTPRFGVAVADAEIELPSPPGKPHKQHFPWAMMMMPIALGGSLLITSNNPRFLIYLMAWPLALLAGHFIQARQYRKDYEEEVVAWREDCAEVLVAIDEAAVAQRKQSFEDEPELGDLGQRLATKQLVWVRRKEDSDFLKVRVGIGTVPALTRLKSGRTGAPGELRAEIREMVSTRSHLEHMPVTAELRESKVVALVGNTTEVDDTLRGMLMRIAINHSPFDVSICAALSPHRRELEGVLRWLPHSRPLSGGDASVAIGATDGRALVERLADLRGDQHVVCVVDEQAGITRRVIEAIAQAQEHCTFVWLGHARHHAPAATGTAIDLVGGGPADGPAVLLRDRGGVHDLDTVDHLDLRVAWHLSRTLSGLRDVAAIIPPDNALPGAVRLTDVGSDLTDVDDDRRVLERWLTSRGLRAQVGVGIDGVVSLDLREDGPHGLVAGTTGAGKSELLQSLIVSLAANNPPHRMTFLLVDYKGGAAFRECASLPHTVGYITDLTPALVQRALISMNAELTWREGILEKYGAKDLLALERDHPEAAPPSMLICVDEFAALLAEVPDFIDGMVSIAQRGRSLGMHMILATQRPSGVISAQIKANTDLRIALRVASDDDSDDVIDNKDAANISRRTPGRAWIKRTGHGTTELVQVAYVGGREPLAEALAPVQVRPHSAIAQSSGIGFSPDGTNNLGPAVHERTDLDRLVRTVNRAHKASGADDPRLPWLPALPDLLSLAQPGEDWVPGRLTVGLIDEPAAQRQVPLNVDLGKVGHVLIFGTSGSGKSEALRTFATAAMLAPSASPTLVYGIDAAGGGLASLDELPSVGSIVPLATLERSLRLLRMMKRSIEERNAMLAGHGAADVDQLARQGVDVSRVLLLIDNLPSLLDTIDSGNMTRRSHGAMLTSVLQDGRRCGIHVIATTPQRSGLGLQVTAAFGARIVLRMTNEDDYSMLGVPTTILDADTVPGRCLVNRLEAQLSTLTVGHDEEQAAAQRLARDLVRQSWTQRYDTPSVPVVPAMPDRVPAAALPTPVGGSVYIGVDSDLATAVGVPLMQAPLLVAGRGKAGKTSTLAAIASLVRRGDAEATIVVVSPRDGAAGPLSAWATTTLTTPEQLAAWRPSGPTTLLVDDLHVWEARHSDPGVRDALTALTELIEAVHNGIRSDLSIVCAMHADHLRDAAMNASATAALKRGRRAALISPTDSDGLFIGCDVPSYPIEPLTGIGRALLADQGSGRVVQLATA